MKSNLSRDMQDSQLRIDFARKAIELNPESVCWHQTLYSALCSLRRSVDFRQHPSQEEIDCCEKAFELWSNQHGPDISIGIAVTMARLYSELLFTFTGNRQHPEISAKAVKFARDAVRLRPKSFTLKIRLVSLLTSYHICGSRGYSNEDRAEVQKLVKECEANVGQCTSEICHKIGKYYNSMRNVDFNSAKALEWFEISLDVHKTNFPCFADMLRNEEFRRKSSAAIIDKIDTILDAHPKQCFQCQLMFIKGFFLWTVDKEAALHLWLNAVEEATDLKVNFVSLGLHNMCYLKNRSRVEALQMMRNVEFFMSRNELANSDDRSFMVLKNIFNSVIEGLKPRWN
ncbi:uncharacterized protein LOC119073568 [Bradysia coprophila]|uniref:uncharacterized protein LOC119073568 n=1 Tax=Bradysia coprophila TaxID=38358 RepID=UPI00187DBF4B|nr:uncharacterized protein LOC119073568 [Bradysia coprophila]